MCWYNFDINEETTSGSGTTHTTHGIVVHELAPSTNPGIVEAEPSCLKIKALRFCYSQPAPEACYVKNKASSVEYVPHAEVSPDESHRKRLNLKDCVTIVVSWREHLHFYCHLSHCPSLPVNIIIVTKSCSSGHKVLPGSYRQLVCDL